MSTEYYGSGKRNGRSRVLSDDGRCFGYTAPFFSYTEKTHVSFPPQKKLYFPRFFSSGFELGRVRFHSFLPYSGNSAASLVTTQAQQQKRLDSGEEKAEGETLFSRVTTYECSFPRLQCLTEKRKSPFSSRLGDVEPWGRMRNSKKECLRSTDSFIETDHFGK